MRKWLFWTSAALGVAPAALGAAAPQAVSPDAAPPGWLAYAEMTSLRIQARLESDEPAALRLRAYVLQSPDGGKPAGMDLKIAVWLDDSGTITRINHTPLGEAQVNEDLEALFLGLRMAEAPPTNMLLPLRLAVHIRPTQQDSRSQAAPSSSPGSV